MQKFSKKKLFFRWHTVAFEISHILAIIVQQKMRVKKLKKVKNYLFYKNSAE